MLIVISHALPFHGFQPFSSYFLIVKDTPGQIMIIIYMTKIVYITNVMWSHSTFLLDSLIDPSLEMHVYTRCLSHSVPKQFIWLQQKELQ